MASWVHLAQILPGCASLETFYFLFWKCRLQEGLMQAVPRAKELTVQPSHKALSACYPGSPCHVPCLCQWKLPEWTFCVHSTPSQCCRGQGWSQLGHAEGRSSQRLTLLFPLPPPSRSPCGQTAVPHYKAHLILYSPGQHQTSSRPFTLCG